MSSFARFNLGLMGMPAHWRAWMVLLVAANLVAPLFFIARIEAQVVVAALVASMVLMTMLTGVGGFTRLLGLGHLPWVPLVYFLWTRLDQIPADTALGIWIRVLVVINVLSLMIDSVDVARYLAGDRTEKVSEA